MDKAVKGVAVKIEGDASELKEELREVRNLAKKASAAVRTCTAQAKHMKKVLETEQPDGDDVLLALRRFVIRVSQDERATPEQLAAMSEVASILL